MDLDADGDLQNHNGILPTQAIAERYDIVVNFGKNGIRAGDKLYFVNLQEHSTGLGPKQQIPLADVLSERYKAVLKAVSGGGVQWDKGDPVVGKFMELRVKAYTGTDLALNPADYEPAKPAVAGRAARPAGKKMIPLWINDPVNQASLATAKRREFVFGRSGSGTDLNPWTVKTDNGGGLSADPRRIAASPQLATGPTDAGYTGNGTYEIWKIVNGGQGWSHPIHVHFEEGIILRRGGKAPPEWEKWARKDVYRVGGEADSTSSVEMAIHFREFAGTYVEHCHNTQHEDNAMLIRWDIEHPGQFLLMPTPLPTWDGVEYVDSAALPTARTGVGTGTSF
jgi:FtsP/CotA-like multicopper oxidase with cupredoxin domain